MKNCTISRNRYFSADFRLENYTKQFVLDYNSTVVKDDISKLSDFLGTRTSVRALDLKTIQNRKEKNAEKYKTYYFGL